MMGPDDRLPSDGDTRQTGYVFTRATRAEPHRPHRQRAEAADPGFALHPAIARGLQMFRETADCGGATALTLLSTPGLHVSYAWFKSAYSLPLHSHDVDCYYLVVAGAMKVGLERLGQGDDVLIPAGAPYTVAPEASGVEFLEIRTSSDYDTHHRAKTDDYRERVGEIRREAKARWMDEPQPYGLVPVTSPGAA